MILEYGDPALFLNGCLNLCEHYFVKISSKFWTNIILAVKALIPIIRAISNIKKQLVWERDNTQSQRSENRVEYLDTDTFVVSISRYFSKKIYPKQSI